MNPTMTLDSARNLLSIECAVMSKSTDAAWKVVDAHLTTLAAERADGDAVVIETAGFIKRDAEGDLFVDWVLEGGIHALEEGCEVMVSDTHLTNDEGYGEIYLHPSTNPPETASKVVGEQAGGVVRCWPFVESPGEFTKRLRAAMVHFPLLGAVRHVLIENPPAFAIAPTMRAVPDSPLAGKYADVLVPFVAMMDRELHANAGKGDRPGWLSMSTDTCLLEIFYHLAKLQRGVKDGDVFRVREYGADVANISMMLVDICGLLIATPNPSAGTGEG